MLPPLAHGGVVSVRFQTWDSGRGVYLTYQSGCWPPGSPCIPQTPPVTGPSWLAYPASYLTLNSPSHGLGFPSLHNPTILVPCSLCTFGPPGSCTRSPSLPSPHVTQLSPVLSGFSQRSLPLAVLSHIATINLLLHHT